MVNEQPLRTVQRRSLESRAGDELRSAIISRRLVPGSRLTEVQVSEMLGISRGTARTALQKLHVEGLVAQRPYAAWEVTGLSEEDAWELFTLRGALEGLAAELVAEGIAQGKIDTSQIEAAFAALQDACERRDVEGADVADFEFHKLIIRLARHERLLMQYERVDAQIRMLIAAGNEGPDMVAQLVPEHQPLLAALMSGPTERAGSVFRAHSLQAGQETIQRMRETEA